ncbi:MAG TPA: YhdP family protein [Pseudomonadales bacterium]|nr:YhdP family protein [Pseudomonadales bacterium]
MPKRLVIRLINLVWYSTALLIVLAAMLVAAGRELLPQINLDNKKLVNYISERTGANIQATRLRCQWTQLYPEFSAQELVVTTPELNMQMSNVRIDINLLSSLTHRTPVFDKLQLTEANIRYTDNTTTDTSTDPEKTWHIISLLLNNDVQIQNVNLEWQKGEKSHRLHLNDFRVEKDFYSKKFFLRLFDEQGQQNLYAVGELQGDALHSSEGKLYIQAEHWLLDEWIKTPTPYQFEITKAEAWLTWQGMESANATAKLQIHPQTQTDHPLPESVNTTLSANWRQGNTSTIDIHSLSLQQQQKDWPLLADTRISINTTQPEQWQIQAPQLSLDNLKIVNDYLPAGDLKTVFHSLNPQGYLRNINLQWNNNKPITERMQLRANADNISSGAWNGVPGFTHVSGYLHSGIGYGFIDLDSRNGFSMFYPQIYHEPMTFQRAAGRVQWQWSPDKNNVLVGSDYASLSGDAGEARGNFWLDIPLTHAPSVMYLAIGLRDSQAKYRDMFLPFILPTNLLSWLKTSIGDASLPNAGFIYRGPLSKSGPYSDAIQFYADINNGDLQFDPSWPRLTQLNADLLVDDGATIVRANSGFIYNTAIQGAYVEVLQQNPGLSINVNARARGYAEDGLRILKDTPLKSLVGSEIDSWRMPQGLLSTGLQLQIPLAGATVPAKEDVRIALADTQLVMDDLRLDFKAINGGITYQTSTGLTAPEISAVLFGKPLKLNIASKKTTQDLTININGKGSASTINIADWAKLTPLKMLEGQVDYDVALKLGPFGSAPSPQIGQLQVNSNLKDVMVPLPAPFSKQRGEQKSFNLAVNLLQNNRQDYQLEYDKQLSGFFSVRDGNLFGGELVLLGDTARAPTEKGNFLIRGALPSGDLQQWLDLIAAYNKLPQAPSGNDTFYPALALTFNNATWKDMSFPKLQLSAGHDNNAWKITFDSGNARGNAVFYDKPLNNKQRVPDITLSELKLYRGKDTSAPTTTSNTSQKPSINFADIPALNIRIDHLFINDMDVGNISTELRSNAKQLRFDNLLATGPGYQLRDGTGTSGSSLLWQQTASGNYQSEFHGLLAMQGEQPAINQLGVDMFIIGKRISMFADLVWPGSPQDASINTLSGNIYTEGKDGKYLQANPNAAMRALGFINVATWARRLQLNFSDLGNKGISFDEYNGKLEFNRGVLTFSKPLEIKTSSGQLALSGKALLEKETLDLRLIATLPVGNNATWIAAAAVSLPAAAGVYLVSKVFDKQINSLTSLSYSITGPMNEPDIRFERIAPPSTTSNPTSPDGKKNTPGSALTDVTKWF